MRSRDEYGKRLDIGVQMGDALVEPYGENNQIRFLVSVPAQGDGAVLVRDEANETSFQTALPRDVGGE